MGEIINHNNALDKTYTSDLCGDITSRYIPKKLDDIELQIDRLKLRWSEFTYLIGQRLKYISENRLFEEKNYPNFKTYVKIALKMSENNAYYYIAVYDYFTEEQTRRAGSKLKLIIPVLNKIKNDRKLEKKQKKEKIEKIRDDLYNRVYNTTYREAEKIITGARKDFFNEVEKEPDKIIEKNDRIIINEKNGEIRRELLGLIEDFYLTKGNGVYF